MGENMQRFGNVLADRMKKTSRANVGITAELGTINSNLSLSADSLKTPIPKGDYMVNLLLTSGGSTGYAGEHTHSIPGGGYTGSAEGHSHSLPSGGTSGSDGGHLHSLPSEFRTLRAGDRVLIVWCGTEPVVAAIVVRS